MALLPVGMKPLAGVGVLIEVGAVEKAGAVLVGGEVGGHPVQDDADAVPVQVVDEKHEILGGAVAAGGGEVAGGLVAPGAVKGVLHDRHEFHVGETQALDVLGQQGRQLPVGEEAVALFRHPPPGAQVHLVDGLGGVQGIGPEALRHPVPVFPGVVQVPDDGGGAGRAFKGKGEGVGLVHPVGAVFGGHVVLVQGARPQTGDEPFPDAGLGPVRQGVAAFVPAVEVAGDPDLLCVRGPHGKVGPRHPFVLEPMGPQLMVQAVVIAFVKEVEVVIGQERDVMPHRDRGGLGLGLGLFVYHGLIFIDLDVYCKD